MFVSSTEIIIIAQEILYTFPCMIQLNGVAILDIGFSCSR